MIHVDIRYLRSETQSADTADVIVEVSNDGAPWHRLATFPYTVGDESMTNHVDRRKGDACTYARAWRDGARYAGAEVRGTAFGYAL
mgnify:CR=1 FL=1